MLVMCVLSLLRLGTVGVRVPVCLISMVVVLTLCADRVVCVVLVNDTVCWLWKVVTCSLVLCRVGALVLSLVVCVTSALVLLKWLPLVVLSVVVVTVLRMWLRFRCVMWPCGLTLSVV